MNLNDKKLIYISFIVIIFFLVLVFFETDILGSVCDLILLVLNLIENETPHQSIAILI